MAKGDREDKEKILCSYLLLCEGRDEMEFLITYLNAHLIGENQKYDDIQIIDFKGIKQLTKKLRALTAVESFDNVKGIAIIRDAETNAAGAQQSIVSSLGICGIDGNLFSSNPYYLFPGKDSNGNWQNGTLEDLCIEIISDNILEEVSANDLLLRCETFLGTVETARGIGFLRKHKNLLHTYFSATDKFVDLKIGEAARAGAFNWQHTKLNDLKVFLLTLTEMGREVQ